MAASIKIKRKMKILVAAGFECLSQRAHAINTVKMAQGFARCGHDVTLICRSGKDKAQKKQFYEQYGVTENIRLIQIINSAGERWVFALLALPYLFCFRPHLVFTRNYILPWLTSALGFPTVGESHAHTDNRTKDFLRFVSATHRKAFRNWVTISPYLEKHYYHLGVPDGKITVLPDAVDLNLFSPAERLPQSPYQKEVPNVVYAGHLYDYKGIPTILNAAKLLPDILFHLLGGLPEDVQRQKRRIKEMALHNVSVYGHVPHADVPVYLWHASILLLPPSADHPSAKWTSPVKLGEYMASGIPVIATAIPALRYWLTDKDVKFIEPDNPSAMVDAINELLGSSDITRCLVSNALKKARELSYTKRAKRIVNILCPDDPLK